MYIVVLAALQVSTVQFRSFKTLRLSAASIVALVIALATPIVVAMSLGQPWLMLLIFTGGYIAWGLTEHVIGLFRSETVGDEGETEAA